MNWEGLFPLNKRLLGSPSLSPSQCPARAQWRLSHVALAEGSSYRKQESGFDTRPIPQIESEIRQSRECGERGCPSLFPPGSVSPWPSPTYSPDSQTEVTPPSLTHMHTHAHTRLCTHPQVHPCYVQATHTHTRFSIRVKTVLKKVPNLPPKPSLSQK